MRRHHPGPPQTNHPAQTKGATRTRRPLGEHPRDVHVEASVVTADDEPGRPSVTRS